MQYCVLWGNVLWNTTEQHGIHSMIRHAMAPYNMIQQLIKYVCKILVENGFCDMFQNTQEGKHMGAKLYKHVA